MFPRLCEEYPIVQRTCALSSITSIWIFVSLFIGFCFSFATCTPLPSPILARGVLKERHNVEKYPRSCQTWTVANRRDPIDFLSGGLSLSSVQQRGDRQCFAFGHQDLVVATFLANHMECVEPRDGMSSTTLNSDKSSVLFCLSNLLSD